jgi:uncharacterized membrane protein YhaH (DUF805 family)
VNVFTNNKPIRHLVGVWISRDPIGRRVYLTHGAALAVLKYAGDFLLIYAGTGTLWIPLHYVQAIPALLPSSWNQPAGVVITPGPAWLAPAFWMLPFIAVGVTLTARRLLDAGRSPWLSILFLVPYVNYALMAMLSVHRSRSDSHERPAPAASASGSGRARVLSAAAGILVAVAAVGIGVSTIRTYGGWLFIVTPFAVGACTAFFYNRGRQVPARETQSLVVITVLLSGTALLFVSFEGVICLLMALPIAIPLAILGGTIGRWAAMSGTGSASPAMFMLLALPLTAAIEPAGGRRLHEVRSSVVIDAPPAVVWPHVIAFREMPDPRDWVFRAGVAYPIRARIVGTGVGAVRYCVFSTGSFIEPITRWEPGRRLSFDVTDSPAPMRELSPYRDVSPPHLHGYLNSKRGEFRFVDLGDGRTRLEGSTWYQIDMAPEVYWQTFSDALIHRIHRRVLEHIKHEVETTASR